MYVYATANQMPFNLLAGEWLEKIIKKELISGICYIPYCYMALEGQKLMGFFIFEKRERIFAKILKINLSSLERDKATLP